MNKEKRRHKLNRYKCLFNITLLLFSVIIIRLFYMQIIDCDGYRELATNRSVRYMPDPAPRGIITDRNGVVLADNKHSYMLVYVETEESKNKFFKTFNEVFTLLDGCVRVGENEAPEKETIKDDFQIKIKPFRFDFKSQGEKSRWEELRFKKDRGLHGKVIRDLFKGEKGEADLTAKDKALVNEYTLKISPEETFNRLVVKYDLYKLLNLSKESEKKLLKEKTSKEITKLLLKKFSLEELRKFVVVQDTIRMQNYSSYKPVVIAENIDRSTAFLFEQLKGDLPGIDVTMQPIRKYPHKELGSNFLGHINRINSSRQEELEQRGYDVNTDYIGAAGLEAAFEEKLKGVKGGETVRVNKFGRRIEELFKLQSYPGENLVLTIDKELQEVTERALADTMKDLQINHVHLKDGVDTKNATRGAAVVLNVNTGEVLALASLPGYDPNIFSLPGALTPELYNQYFTTDYESFTKQYISSMKLNSTEINTDLLFPKDSSNLHVDKFDICPKPFYNYATNALVPPGSTFKPLTAIAGLEEGVIDARTKIIDAGVFDEHPPVTDNFPGACWMWNEYKSNHRPLNVIGALEQSCNYFFFEVGYRLLMKGGQNNLARYAWKFGLGYDPKSDAKRGTGIEISENKFGNVYNIENYRSLAVKSSIQTIVNGLASGNFRNIGKFTAIDAAYKKNDNPSMAEAKLAFKDNIRNLLMNEKLSAAERNEFAARNRKLLKQIIDSMPKSMRDKYSIKETNKVADEIKDYILWDVYRDIYRAYQVFNASIGQGVNEFTPVQLVNYMATFANGGTRYRVHLVDKFTDANNKVVKEVKPEIIERINLKPSTIKAVKEGMEKVNEEEGTAFQAFDKFPIKTAGKTGSATYKENGLQEKVGRTSYGIYVGFAPYDKPEIAVSVVIFDGGHGGYVAPVARAVYEYYFREELKKVPNFKPKFSYTLS
jgi:penicillin-binding protein 2